MKEPFNEIVREDNRCSFEWTEKDKAKFLFIRWGKKQAAERAQGGGILACYKIHFKNVWGGERETAGVVNLAEPHNSYRWRKNMWGSNRRKRRGRTSQEKGRKRNWGEFVRDEGTENRGND